MSSISENHRKIRIGVHLVAALREAGNRRKPAVRNKLCPQCSSTYSAPDSRLPASPFVREAKIPLQMRRQPRSEETVYSFENEEGHNLDLSHRESAICILRPEILQIQVGLRNMKKKSCFQDISIYEGFLRAPRFKNQTFSNCLHSLIRIISISGRCAI
jgi:hypothetical protein